MLSVSEIDELNDLLDKEENGESVDEDRIYELDLLSRWQIGEELTHEEKADVAAFKARRKKDKERDFDAPAPSLANVLDAGSGPNIPESNNEDQERKFGSTDLPDVESSSNDEDSVELDGIDVEEKVQDSSSQFGWNPPELSLIHISEPTRPC